MDSIVPGVDMKRFRILHYAKCNHASQCASSTLVTHCKDCKVWECTLLQNKDSTSKL